MQQMSKSKISWVRSLGMKKHRDREQLFVAEGVKLVGDLLPHLSCRLLIITDRSWLSALSLERVDEVVQVADSVYQKLSSQPSPQGVLGLFEQVDTMEVPVPCRRELSLFLDDVQDPGNLGTIIRLCDWFGVQQVFCSLHTVDVYNPKTVQATMGAIARVRVCYVDKVHWLQQLPTDLPVFGTYMEGESLYTADLPLSGLLIMGNEGRGISPEVAPFVHRRLTIPRFLSADGSTSESLNVGLATAIFVSEFRRRG